MIGDGIYYGLAGKVLDLVAELAQLELQVPDDANWIGELRKELDDFAKELVGYGDEELVGQDSA